MNNSPLNLARAWRSKNFDQIIGQDISVRILKNSLFADHLFPVYLFAGERGCGKTSTARIFSAAVNCEKLALFRQDPATHQVPCLTCVSCMAIGVGAHPDVIEIDAASHTGVDNVRSIIDAATLLPVMGGKRIYLIDEAHMLSKAAFNAFLKLLEEPPSSVFFILATTDPHKIIETVRSRCFQVFFEPVDHEVLWAHLKKVCDAQKISYEDEGLWYIARESKGLVRDALNIVEQVRFAVNSMITKDDVLKVLGHIDEERMVQLFYYLLQGDIASLLAFLQTIGFESRDPEHVWYTLYSLVRSALRMSFEIHDGSQFAKILQQHRNKDKNMLTHQHIMSCLETMCSSETLFVRSSKKHAVLEMLFLRICMSNNRSPQGKSVSTDSDITPQFIDNNLPKTISVEPRVADEQMDRSSGTQEVVADRSPPKNSEKQSADQNSDEALWKLFLSQLDSLHDQLLPSLFGQGKLCWVQKSAGVADIVFPQRLIFFKDLIKEAESTWFPLLCQTYLRDNMNVELKFTESDSPHNRGEGTLSRSEVANTGDSVGTSRFGKPGTLAGEKRVAQKAKVPSTGDVPIDVSDSALWKVTHMLLKHFAGTIVEFKQE